jgi:hypothetical protein
MRHSESTMMTGARVRRTFSRGCSGVVGVCMNIAARARHILARARMAFCAETVARFSSCVAKITILQLSAEHMNARTNPRNVLGGTVVDADDDPRYVSRRCACRRSGSVLHMSRGPQKVVGAVRSAPTGEEHDARVPCHMVRQANGGHAVGARGGRAHLKRTNRGSRA